MESKTRLTSRGRRLTGPVRAGGPGRTWSGARHRRRAGRFVVIGIISWDAVAGLQGVCICGALGVAAGAALGRPESRAARIIGGGIGGVVAAWFALASGEMFPPGTLQWALSGGAYAALFAFPVAALVGGLVGLLNPASRSGGNWQSK